MSDFSDIMALADQTIVSVMGVSGTYTRPGEDGASVDCILDEDQQIISAGGESVSEHRTVIHLIVSQLSAVPEHGDVITIGSDAYEVDRVLERDADQLMLSVEVTRR